MTQAFNIGDRVRVVIVPPYVKTAEPKPMLRPPNVLQLGAEGTVIERRPGGWGVRFAKGAFLMDEQCLQKVPDANSEVETVSEPEVQPESEV